MERDKTSWPKSRVKSVGNGDFPLILSSLYAGGRRMTRIYGRPVFFRNVVSMSDGYLVADMFTN